jgi:hypothetical protein
MTMARVYLATAAFITLAISGIAASSPRPTLGAAPLAAVQPVSSPTRATGVEATIDDGVATAWLRGGPQPATVCKPGPGCCFWVMPHICGQCSANC